MQRLLDNVNREQAKRYFERREGKAIPAFRVSGMIDQMLRDFILRDELPTDLKSDDGGAHPKESLTIAACKTLTGSHQGDQSGLHTLPAFLYPVTSQ